MNDKNLPELPDDPIRKALKKLPAVKAAPDFEARLKRRLLEPAQEAGVAWRIFSGEISPNPNRGSSPSL